MAKFEAAKRMTALEFDFGDYAPEHLRPMRGTIPEPSRLAVLTFNHDLNKGLEAIGKAPDDPNDRLAVMRAYEQLTTEDLWQIDEHVVDAIMTLTENNPPREQYVQLGNRAQMVFREWLQNECNRPEAPTPATTI